MPDSAEPRPGLRVHAALLLVQLIFGGFHVVAKWSLAHLHPLALAGLRVALATPLLLAVAWRRDRVVPRPGLLPYLALLGLLGVFANQLLYILGLQYTSATNASILMPSIPVFAVMAAAALGVETLGRRRLLGVALAVAGALVILSPAQLLLRRGTAFGNLLILCNCLSFSLYLVLQRPILSRLPWRTVIAWTFVLGGAGVLVVSWPQVAALRLGSFSPAVWWGVAYLALFATATGYSLNTWAVRRSSPSLVATYTTLQPVAAGILAALFLGESLGWAEVAGFALIAGGLWQVSRDRGASCARTGGGRVE